MASGSCGTRDKLKPQAARAGDPTCSLGQRSLVKKGQVYFGRFYLGKRRTPAVICSHLSHGNRRRFRKYAANFDLAEHTRVLR